MNTDIARQPLVPAFLTLLALSLAAVYAPNRTAAVAEAPSLLGYYIGWIAAFSPVFTRILCGILLISAATITGRLSVRYGLYSGNSCIAIPLFGITACIAFPESGLSGAFVLLLLALSTHNFCRAFRNGYGFDPLFRGSLYLGLMPLICPHTVCLLLLMPLAILLFKRTLRELTVAAAGLLLPILTACYIEWGIGEHFFTPVTQIYTAIAAGSFHVQAAWGNATIILAGSIAVLNIFAIYSYIRNIYAAGSKARAIMLYTICLLCLLATEQFVAAFVHSFTGPGPEMLLLAAVPSSLLIPAFLVRIHRSLSLPLYLFLLLAAISALFLR